MISFWEKESITKADIIIVGSGIVGLSTAASLLEKNPNVSLTLLERGILPSGASTKNAGFACFGSITELLADLQHDTPENIAALVEKRWQGIQHLKLRLGEDKIDFKQFGGYELLMENQYEQALEKMDEINALLHPIFKGEVFSQADEQITTFGFNTNKVTHLIKNAYEGQIDTGKMMHNLMQYVTKLGGRIITGASVEEFEELNDEVKIHVSHMASNITWQCKKVVFCTNAFTKKFFPSLEITPGRGQILVTKPIEKLKFRGAFHFDEGYFYFRDIGNRVIFGGGRNVEYENEKTDQFGENKTLIDLLHKYLEEIIFPNTAFEVDYNWSGIMGFGAQKDPIIKKISTRIAVGARLGGMGVAIGTTVGNQLSNMLTED